MSAQTGVRPGRWIRRGWEIVRADLGGFILVTLIAVALALVGSFLVAGPLLAGMFIAVRRRILEGRMEVGDLFAGFNVFIDSFLVFIVSSIFSFIGLALCIFPAFIVTALYLYPYLYLVDHRKLNFWEAMEASRKTVMQHLGGYVAFVILLLLLNLFGVMLLGIGVLITIPVSVAAITVAYQESVGFNYKPLESHRPVVIV